MMDQALALSKAQANAASQAAQAMNACVAAMLEASAAFAKTSAERNAAMATTMMSAKSIDSVADIHAAFVRDAMRAAGAMAVKVADACTTAAKQCNELAARTTENVAASVAANGKATK
jgi:hypothetical protein